MRRDGEDVLEERLSVSRGKKSLRERKEEQKNIPPERRGEKQRDAFLQNVKPEGSVEGKKTIYVVPRRKEMLEAVEGTNKPPHRYQVFIPKLVPGAKEHSKRTILREKDWGLFARDKGN